MNVNENNDVTAAFLIFCSGIWNFDAVKHMESRKQNSSNSQRYDILITSFLL